MELSSVFITINEQKASSLHLSVGAPLLLNINGRLQTYSIETVTFEEIDQFAVKFMNKFQYDRFLNDHAVNFTAQINNFGRFRFSFFKQKGLTIAVIKPLASSIPNLEELNLPETIKTKILKIRNGLIIISGPSGCGKSTTLAAIIDNINSEAYCHIVTLEDPIEYSHLHKKLLISQREIGSDSNAFSQAVREAIRQDADVIMIAN